MGQSLGFSVTNVTNTIMPSKRKRPLPSKSDLLAFLKGRGLHSLTDDDRADVQDTVEKTLERLAAKAGGFFPPIDRPALETLVQFGSFAHGSKWRFIDRGKIRRQHKWSEGDFPDRYFTPIGGVAPHKIMLRLQQNRSGVYRAKHDLSFHVYYEDEKGNVVFRNTIYRTRWEGHFTKDVESGEINRYLLETVIPSIRRKLW